MKPSNRPPGCQNCPRFDRGVGFVRPSGNLEARFIIIGESPSEDDIYQSQAFFSRGYTGGTVINWLYRASLQRGDVIFTDLVWCMTKKDNSWNPKPPAHAAIKYCWKTHLGPYLAGLSEQSKPRYIITLGPTVMRWFKGMIQKEAAEAHYGTCELHNLPEAPNA